MNIKILIVDDEESMEKLIKRIFRNEQTTDGYTFSYYKTADAAYQYIGTSSDVDIVLLDINMPGQMDGLTLLEKIHKMNPLVKVIMISAYGDMKRSRIAMQHGAFDFLEKPIDQDDLRFVVRRAVEYIIESKKVTQLVGQVNLLNYFVKNDAVDLIKYQSVNHAMEDCKKEVAAILVTTIREYTKQTADMDPSVLVKMLNDYHTEITRAVDMYDGYIDRYIENSAIGIFYGDDYLRNAVAAGLKIRALVDKLNQVRIVNNEKILSVSVALNAGEVIVGNIGSFDPIRLNHTVIGDPVSFCFQLQTLATSNELLFAKNSFTEQLLCLFSCKFIHSYLLREANSAYEIYRIEK